MLSGVWCYGGIGGDGAVIDDVVLTDTIPADVEVRPRAPQGSPPPFDVFRFDPRSGQRRPWQVVVGRSFVVYFCPTTRWVEIKLNIAKLGAAREVQRPINYPLRSYRSVDEMPLSPVAWAVAEALGIADQIGEPDLASLGVRSIGIAVDVEVSDVTGTVQTLRSLPRRCQEVQSHGWPPHSATWKSDGANLTVYDKGKEILDKIPHLRGREDERVRRSREERQLLAAQAENRLRFEVNLRSARHLRAPWKLEGGTLPTFRLMAMPAVHAYLLGRELNKLGLADLDDEMPSASDGDDCISLLATIDEAIRRQSADSGRKPWDGDRSKLLAVHLLQGRRSNDDICRLLKMKDGTRRKYAGILKKLGLPALGTSSPHGHQLLREFVAGFDDFYPDVPDEAPAIPSHRRDEYVTRSPWADDLPEDRHDHADNVETDFDDIVDLGVATA